MDEVTYKPIGVVHSPFKEPKNVPIQASASKGTTGTNRSKPRICRRLTGPRRLFSYYSPLSFQLSQGMFFVGEAVSG
jgi:hypothetical protein